MHAAHRKSTASQTNPISARTAYINRIKCLLSKKFIAHFIDFEYCGANYQAYDIGDHFSEFVGSWGQYDYDQFYPDLEFQRAWISEYLKEFRDDKEVTDKEVDELLVWVNQFSLCSNIWWGLWSLFQAKVSVIEYDFIGSARGLLEAYKRRKPQILNTMW